MKQFDIEEERPVKQTFIMHMQIPIVVSLQIDAHTEDEMWDWIESRTPKWLNDFFKNLELDDIVHHNGFESKDDAKQVWDDIRWELKGNKVAGLKDD